MDLNEIRLDLEEISTRSGWISKRSGEFSKRSGQISTRSCQISTDQTKSGPLTTPIGGEQKFQCVFRSGQLKIGFSCSNPSTNLPVLGFRGEDPLPIVANVRSASFRAGLVRCQV